MKRVRKASKNAAFLKKDGIQKYLFLKSQFMEKAGWGNTLTGLFHIAGGLNARSVAPSHEQELGVALHVGREPAQGGGGGGKVTQ